eukprot:3935660-Rhodomonas_salina.1
MKGSSWVVQVGMVAGGWREFFIGSLLWDKSTVQNLLASTGTVAQRRSIISLRFDELEKRSFREFQVCGKRALPP